MQVQLEALEVEHVVAVVQKTHSVVEVKELVYFGSNQLWKPSIPNSCAESVGIVQLQMPFLYFDNPQWPELTVNFHLEAFEFVLDSEVVDLFEVEQKPLTFSNTKIYLTQYFEVMANRVITAPNCRQNR